jgi:hypothetical protein
MHNDLGEILRTGGLWLNGKAGRLLHLGFAMQSYMLTGLCVLGAMAASARDHTLVMSGRNVGLLQYPTIWSFFGLQLALPLTIRRSLSHLFENKERIDWMSGEESAFAKQIVQPIRNVWSAALLQAKSEDSGLVCANVSGL